MSLFAIDLCFAQPLMHVDHVNTIAEFITRSGSWRILTDMAMLGAFAGIANICRASSRLTTS
jgi:hypothetical protein